ncbi:hypothetical protein Tco_0190376 [Tanacetum coccineum]
MGVKGIKFSHLMIDLIQVVLDLQKDKDAQAAEILKLKTRIKKLEKKCKTSISHHRAWLRSVSKLSRMKKLGMKESVSKQGRKNAKLGPTLDAFDDLDADLAYGIDYMETEEAMNEGRQSNETKELNLDVDTEVIAEDKGSGEKGGSTVSTARLEVDTARPDIDTARPEVHTANAPVSTAGVTISTADPEVSVVEPRTPPPTTNVEDSSRPVRSITTLKPLPSIDPKDKGKGILVEEEPVKIKRNDQGIDQIERDEELAHKLHVEELAEIARIQEEKAAQEEASREEREEYTIKERAKFLAETIAAQRKFRVAQRAAEIRNDAVKDSKKAVGEDTSKKEEVLKEHDSTKIEKSDLEKEEYLKTFLKIVPDKEGIINYEVLIFRSDGSSRWIKTFSEMVTRFNRLDLVELHNLVMQRFESITSCNNHGLSSLCGIYENYGVHTLILEDGTEIHMLAERKYPLTKETLERMISLKLIAESASDSAYVLLRFIQKQIDEAGSHDGGEKDL